MNIVIAIVSALVTGAVVAGIVVAAMRRSVEASAAVDPGEDIRRLHHDLAELRGRLDGGFDRAARDHDTVRSTLEMLTHSGGRRGTWGEVTLRRLLETAGLTHGCDFDTQATLSGGGRPDVVIRLGGAGTVVVDAKAPLADMRRAWEADDDSERDRALKAHVVSVRRHASELAARDYPSHLDATFVAVVMYLPVDGAWEAATAASPDLVGELQRLGVHPASPSTLGLVLDVLKQHALTVNQEEAVRIILEDTRQFVGRLQTHTDHLDRLGRALEGAVGAYNGAMGNLGSRVLPATARMTDHVGAHGLEAPEPVAVAVRSDRPAVVDSSRERVA
jgi:DNA recombination protein RmuC